MIIAELVSVSPKRQARWLREEAVVMALVVAVFFIPLLSLWIQELFQFEPNAGRPFTEVVTVPIEHLEPTVLLLGEAGRIGPKPGQLVIPMRGVLLNIRIEMTSHDLPRLSRAVRVYKGALLAELEAALNERRLADVEKAGFRMGLRSELKRRFERHLGPGTLQQVFLRELWVSSGTTGGE